jgi:hypothetical protein
MRFCGIQHLEIHGHLERLRRILHPRANVRGDGSDLEPGGYSGCLPSIERRAISAPLLLRMTNGASFTLGFVCTDCQVTS